MISYREKLRHSIVLHPEFMLRGLHTDSLVEEFLDRCELECDRHLKLAGRLWGRHNEAPCANKVIEIFEGEIESGTAESLALFGEIFIENSGDEDVLTRESIDEYFRALGDRSVIFCSLSRSKRLLKEYSNSGDNQFLVSAISSYKKALFRGSLTGLILYVVFRKSAKRKGILGLILHGPYILLLNLFYMFVSGIISMGLDYREKWWRYIEIYHWMPKKVKKINECLINKSVKW